MKIYGPYERPDGRKHVIYYDGVVRRTQSYPRYLMEQHLGRPLLDSETVDHIDGDFTNDNLDNLQLLTLADNIKKSSKGIEWLLFDCPVCGEEFLKTARSYRANQIKQGKAGPYCSKSCAGKVHH